MEKKGRDFRRLALPIKIHDVTNTKMMALFSF